MWILLTLAGVALCTLVLVALAMRRRKLKLSPQQTARVVQQWKNIAGLDPARKVLEAENILDSAFTALGFSGSFGEKLKKIGPRFPQQEALWQAHKLRNRIAHEAGIAVSPHVADRAVGVFGEVLEMLMD